MHFLRGPRPRNLQGRWTVSLGFIVPQGNIGDPLAPDLPLCQKAGACEYETFIERVCQWLYRVHCAMNDLTESRDFYAFPKRALQSTLQFE